MSKYSLVQKNWPLATAFHKNANLYLLAVILCCINLPVHVQSRQRPPTADHPVVICYQQHPVTTTIQNSITKGKVTLALFIVKPKCMLAASHAASW